MSFDLNMLDVHDDDDIWCPYQKRYVPADHDFDYCLDQLGGDGMDD